MSGSQRIGRVVRTTVVAALAVALWLVTAGMPGAVRFWTVTLTVFLPLLAMKQVDGIGNPAELPRIPAYLSSIASLWLIALLTATVARFGGISAADLRLTPIAWPALVAWSLGPLAAGIGILALARRLGVRESALLIRLLPESRAEKQIFAGLSVTAGFCEELVFRGFLLYVLAVPFGLAGAIAASSIVFALAHVYQDARGAARAGLLGLVLAITIVLSGSLWPSMIAHTAIDLIGGLLMKDRLVGEVA